MLFRSDRKSTRLNSSHTIISYAVFCLKKKNKRQVFPGDKHYSNYILGLLINSGSHPLFNNIFFFNDTATTEIYPLSLPDALPISSINLPGSLTHRLRPLCSVFPSFAVAKN